MEGDKTIKFNQPQKTRNMGFDDKITDLTGLTIITIGLISLTESLLQLKIIGGRLPLTQGAFVSMFAVGFGAVMMTEDATQAFKTLKETCQKTINK